MPEYYAPGVHIEKESRGERYLEVVKTDCAVFLGLAERGPVGKALRISSFNDFKNYFGSFLPGSYLPYAVYGFFLNGGRECYIIRIAHVVRRRNEEVVETASGSFKSLEQTPLYKVRASSGGTWGNKVTLEIQPSRQKIKTYPEQNLDRSSKSIRLANARHFVRGDIVRIKSGGNVEHVEIAQVRGQTIELAEAGLRRRYPSGERTEISPIRFDLQIRYGGQKESLGNLSPGTNSKRFIVDSVNKGSRFVRMQFVGDRIRAFPKPGKLILKGGRDGISTIIPDDYIGLSEKSGNRFGLRLLVELEEGRIIALPDLYTHQESTAFGGKKGVSAVLRAAIDYVENSKYRFLLIDSPPLQDIKNVQIWREEFDSSCAAVAYPWLKAKVSQVEQMLPMKLVPPSGYVAGMMAALDLASGTHHSFANREIEGIVDTEYPLMQSDTEILNPDGINTVLAFPGRGIRVWGARTLSSDAAFRYINVRRTFNMISESIEQGTQWVTFEPNRPELWESVKRLVFFFLKSLWKKGYLQGENVEEAFYIKVDEETNPPEVRDRGELIIEVGVAIVRPAEFIIVRVSQKTMETQEE
ncbi:MAG TPA: phage tail sheath family protein [candidate division Zixibacteria bacterium]|nr:phage tail sheath family protein [candidate division Zixibacteria bacterium]